MIAKLRRLGAVLVVELVVGCSPWPALAQEAGSSPVQIYGLTLDETRFDEQFCERTEPGGAPIYPEGHQCRNSRHAVPRINGIHATEFPAPSVVLTFQSSSTEEPETLTAWYLPRDLGGQSFLISTTTHDPRNLEGARGAVLQSLGTPTIEFTPADLEARGLTIFDLSLDTLVFVDPSLPDADRSRVVTRIQREFDPSGDELFFIANSSLQTLARLLGTDFRGAIVQVAESGFGHHCHVTIILLDLKRAQSVFRLED